MTPTLLGSLLLLALVDSTSFGTLVIPIWLMLAPGRVRPARVLAFLATVAAFYLGVGLLLLAGASFVQDAVGGDPDALLALPGVRVAELVLGVGMLVGSFWIDPGPKRRPARPAAHAPEGLDTAADTAAVPAAPVAPGRLSRWRERAMDSRAGLGGLLLLALAAALIEVGSMVPYLAGIGLISTSSAEWPVTGLLVAGYCLVMIAPAVLVLVVRVLAARVVEPPLRRFSDWMSAHAASTTAWIVGIVGFLLARDAALALGLFGA
ncbi:GAP family protein [Herbiconiux sp. P18]|uniref:GAP family protein n=1 Tax=Herbiconiux liangxiaofengii TaxID=3342795 RepID=UPI0035B8AF4A